MNKTNGVRDTASVSTSLYLKEHNCGQRSSSSAFPTFLKWFKKNEKRQKAINGLVSSHSSKLNDSPEALSPPSSPFLGNISPSSSCDSVLSTSTTGFAFIKPQYYRPYHYAEEPKLLFTDNPQTDTPRRRENKYNCYNIENRQLSLREKYFLYDTDTITSNEIESGYDNIKYLDRSLPNAKKKTSKNNNQSIRNRRPHRRTVSDCSKDKRSGAYVHVKGKRKAPPPPQLVLHRSQARHEYFYEDVKTERVSSPSEIYSSGSTLGRKKRKAPPPPPQSPTSFLDEAPKSILSEGLLDDKEIQAIIEGASTGYNITNSTEKNCKMFSKRTSMKSSGKQDHPMDNSKGVSNENLSSTSNHEDTESPNRSPISAISPRPWYKRPISTNRESSIPFKREIVLKTMEKRKNKLKEKEAVSSLLPEVGYSRSSMFDSGYKFGFFSRNKDHCDENKSKDKEKRRSGIGIPNISELDREAAEIVNKEHAHEKAKERAEQEKFFQPPEHLLLQQQMFASKGQNQLASETENAIQVVSTKDLISKFESSSNAARVTLNTSFIGRTDNFFQNKGHDVKIIENNLHIVSSDSDIVRNKSVAEVSKSPSIFSTIELTQDTKIEERQNLTGNGEAKVDKQAQNSILPTTWSCPFCTLENPNWRIICEVCERLKPFDKLGKEGTKPTAKLSAKIDPLPHPQNLKNNIDIKIKSTPQSAQNIVEKVDNVDLKLLLSESNDWEKKADRVMKYFMPRNNNIGLSKSASETAVVKKPPVSRKSPSPSKVPICSPNFSRRSKVQRKEEKSKSNNDIKNSDAIHEKEANFVEKEQKKPLMDSSVIVTTITPVFYATTTSMTQPEVIKRDEYDKKNSSVDLKEVRSARLAKFSAKPQDETLSIIKMSTQSLEEQSLLNNDPDSLEREKMRLREKIRAMNAKALAEKYPVLQNKSTQDNTQLNSNLNEKIEESITKSVTEGDTTKRGAIKKLLNKNLSQDCSTPDGIQEKPITHDILANVSKPKKISTSAQTTGFVKKFNETRSHSRELLSENFNEIKLDNVVHSIDLLSEIPAIQPIQPYIINFSEHEKARVEEISQQLQSLEGISNFKATLRNPLKGISWTDTMALNKIMRSLELAIAEGQDELAAKIAMDLAKMKVSLQVTKVKNRPTSGSIDYNQSIIVDLLVEDKISQKGPIQILVKPLMTILELKEKALKDFEIPIELQKWLINDEPATDNNKILLEYGVRDCTSGFYLYLITPDVKCSEKKEIHLPIPKTSIAIHEDLDGNLSDASSDSHNELETNDSIESVQGAAALPFPENSILESPSKSWQCPLCTLINSADVLACCACSKAKPHSTNFVLPYEDKYNMSEELRQFLEGNKISIQYRISEQKNDLNKTNPNRKSSEIFNIVADQKKAQPTVLLERISPDGFKGALNSPSPNITKNRYRGVDNYNPNRQNGNGVLIAANRIPTPIKKEKLRAPAPPANTKANHYLELLQLDSSDVVSNKVSFECPVCFMQFQKGEGIVLRDCLHSFCKECLSNTVRYSEEAEVKCPYMDAEYSCDSILQQREIKAIVTKEIYEQHLAKSIRVAEHQIENAFHCKTPNCRGWCIYEDNVNEFKCPVCRITNCLLCRVIHDGLTCKQFQDRLNSDCDSNLEARRTKDMIKEMVEKGEAMNCPTCQVIMMKKWGCDWLRCSMCKTEVCWVTRGPRWGPGGKGDTSGGCKCGVDGKKCHPKCNYCH